MSKPLVCVYMTQAAVVYLTGYNLYSAEFSSCCPIVMFNQTTKRAGYYHMPGKTNAKNEAIMVGPVGEEWDIVEDMASIVKPTKIWIFPGIWIGTVIAARKPIQAACNAHNLAMLLAEVKVKIPEKKTGSLAVSLKDEMISFSPYRPEYSGSEWYDSKRDRDKKPDGQEVLFWKWKAKVDTWKMLSTTELT